MFVYRQNILINTNTLAACLKNEIPNYIYIGTACSYPKHLQMSENVVSLSESQTYPADPESSYGWSKLMGEYEAAIAEKEGKIKVGLLRFHNVYGPGSVYSVEKSQVLPSLVRKAIKYPKEKFVIWGNGTQYRDFVYVDDVIESLLLIYSKGMGKGLIQIGSEKATTIKEAAEIIIEISGKRIEVEYDISGPQGDRGRIANCLKAKEILGWYPKTNLSDGLKNLYKSIANNMQL
jgi:GDP-D-mannose 3',5'-epimerase